MSRVALLGGSFDPPHVAHQMMCLWALSTGCAEQVWLVPAYRHPLGKELAPFDHRVRMCELAVEPLAPHLVEVNAIESRLPTPSRTLDTIEALGRLHPDQRFAFLIGADILQQTQAWYRFKTIERLVDIVVVGRAGYATGQQTVILPPISSTDVRSRIAAGESVTHLIPASVHDYIVQHGLYGC